MFLVLALPAFLLYPLLRKEKLKERMLWQLTVEFKDAIWLVSGYLSAGLSVENACEKTNAELIKIFGEKAMIAEEFTAIVRGLRLNKPIELLLTDFADRSGLPDIRNFSEVFAIAKRSGGNLSEIIERTTGMIRDKTSVAEEIRNLTASRRYEQNIMNILPFCMIIYIRMTSPGFLDVMYTTIPGRIIMTLGLLLMLAGKKLSERILDIQM